MQIDIAPLLMGDPGTSFRRPPTDKERVRAIHINYGVWTSRWSRLEVGDSIYDLSRDKAYDGRNWLRKRYRDAVIWRALDGSYQLRRTG